MAIIDIANLDFSYIDRNKSFQVLHDISLKIDDGELLCIIGPSGCGKTTLLRLLAGLQLPTAGRICIDGKQVTGPGTDRAIVFQNYTLFPWMTASKNVQFGVKQVRRQLNKAQIRLIAREYLRKVGMEHAADMYPYQLSGGMRQRVAIARALAMDTDIFLLDEAFGALDAKIRQELQRLLEDLWDNSGGKRKTVVFVTHDINEAIRLADRILFMGQGVIAEDIAVDLPRPRNALDAAATARFNGLRKELMHLFYRSAKMEGCHEVP